MRWDTPNHEHFSEFTQNLIYRCKLFFDQQMINQPFIFHNHLSSVSPSSSSFTSHLGCSSPWLSLSSRYERRRIEIPLHCTLRRFQNRELIQKLVKLFYYPRSQVQQSTFNAQKIMRNRDYLPCIPLTRQSAIIFETMLRNDLSIFDHIHNFSNNDQLSSDGILRQWFSQSEAENNESRRGSKSGERSKINFLSWFGFSIVQIKNIFDLLRI